MRRDALLAAGFAGTFAAITVGLATGGWLIDLDLAVYEWSEAHRGDRLAQIGRILNRLGQGGALLAICVGLAGWLGLRRWWRGADWWRAARPLLYVAAATLLVVPTVLLIKYPLTSRGAPSSPLPAEQTVPLSADLPAGEYAAGYPGGHLINAIVWYGVLLVLVTALLHEYGRAAPPLPVRVAIRVIPPVVVLWTTTFMSFHWLTDGLAGLAFGLAVDRVLALLRTRWGDPR